MPPFYHLNRRQKRQKFRFNILAEELLGIYKGFSRVKLLQIFHHIFQFTFLLGLLSLTLFADVFLWQKKKKRKKKDPSVQLLIFAPCRDGGTLTSLLLYKLSLKEHFSCIKLLSSQEFAVLLLDGHHLLHLDQVTAALLVPTNQSLNPNGRLLDLLLVQLFQAKVERDFDTDLTIT